MGLKMTNLRLQPYLPGTSGLKHKSTVRNIFGQKQ